MKHPKRKILWKRLIGLTCTVAAAACALIMGVSLLLGEVLHIQYDNIADGFAQLGGQSPKETSEHLTGENELPAKDGSLTMHFNGVGDNLLHDVIFLYHEMVYGDRDFSVIYEKTAPYVQNADLAYINFETVCAGDEYGLSGYPNFNGPVEMIDSLAKVGCNWFSTSSNHSMDTGAEGLIHEMDYIKQKHPNIIYTGTHRSQEEADQPVVVEVNGIKVGLVSFTYGLNGYHKPEGMDYLIDVHMNYDMNAIDYDIIDKRINALQDVSDIQIVTMHWGVEYETAPNSYQREVAKYLNSKGVEVIIGSHPHVIQPVEWISTEDQTTLCYYSLGNFLSAQDQNDRMVGGMADFDLSYNPETKEVSFSNVKFIPTITYISPDTTDYRTYTIKEYNDDIAANQYVTVMLQQDCSLEFVRGYVNSVVGRPEGIEIVGVPQPQPEESDSQENGCDKEECLSEDGNNDEVGENEEYGEDLETGDYEETV